MSVVKKLGDCTPVTKQSMNYISILMRSLISSVFMCFVCFVCCFAYCYADDIQISCNRNSDCPVHSYCKNNTCECDDTHATLTEFCQYERKKAQTCLILTCLLNYVFPVGRCYAVNCINDLKHISAKVSVIEVFTSGIICFTIVALISSPFVMLCHRNPRLKYIVYYGLSVAIPFTIAWIIVDIVQFVRNDITDENGIELVNI